MDSLVKAKISVPEDEISEENQRELLGSLCNVTSLELIGFEAEVMLNENPDEFPIFHNLRTLSLHSCFLNGYELTDKLEALGSFLKNAPCLEKLSLQYCMCGVLEGAYQMPISNLTKLIGFLRSPFLFAVFHEAFKSVKPLPQAY
ncbi:unnamed protein product [Miscanthus lutarioriparius]|uniref:Uncharacterized protein n=1 Tax=Miscanthus lutarioriparius TaxID=422564 RepID=A0A811NEF4_9POAL|nr:unnamed protein product [Miscanthus lutarioriparius]